MDSIANYKIFPSPQVLAEEFAADITDRINGAASRRSPMTIAISGGNTPRLLFEVLAEKYFSEADWKMVKIFWVDERCVSPDNPESNYGMTKKILLSKIGIPSVNVFRIRGEDDPVNEALRYSGIINGHTRSKNGFPVFDIVVLGMGDDGHTASIFPGNENLFSSDKICEVTVHPISMQKRITITGKVINNANAIFFLVTGSNKAEIVNEIFMNSKVSSKFPASHVNSLNGSTTWLLDDEAGKFIV